VNSAVHLPSCLSSSTLGDVLGTLHRKRLSGVLQIEVAAKTHEIELQKGFVVRVHLADASARLGERLSCNMADGRQFERALRLALARSRDERPLGERLLATHAAPASAVAQALQELHQSRLDVLFNVRSARLHFRVAYRPLASAMVLGPAVFLHQRRRYRERSKPAERLMCAELRRAYGVLGLAPGEGLSSVKAAWRTRALLLHPDKFVAQGPRAVEQATRRFCECASSYRLLTEFLRHG
jgi:hypothetical protein